MIILKVILWIVVAIIVIAILLWVWNLIDNKRRTKRMQAFESQLTSDGADGELPQTFGSNHMKLYYFPKRHQLMQVSFLTKDCTRKEIADFDPTEDVTPTDPPYDVFLFDRNKHKLLIARVSMTEHEIIDLPIVANADELTFTKACKTLVVQNTKAGKMLFFKLKHKWEHDFQPGTEPKVEAYFDKMIVIDDKAGGKLLVIDDYTPWTYEYTPDDELMLNANDNAVTLIDRRNGKIVIFENNKMNTYDFEPAQPDDVIDFKKHYSNMTLINRSTGTYYEYDYGKLERLFQIPVDSPNDVIENYKVKYDRLFINQTSHLVSLVNRSNEVKNYELPGEVAEAGILAKKKLKYWPLGEDFYCDDYYIVLFCDEAEDMAFISKDGVYTWTPQQALSINISTRDKYEQRAKTKKVGESGYQLSLSSMFTPEDKYVNTEYYKTTYSQVYSGTEVKLTIGGDYFSETYILNDLFYWPESRRHKSDLQDLVNRSLRDIAPLTKRINSHS